MIWEYVNMMIQLHGGVEFLLEFPRDIEAFKNLSDLYQKTSTIPLSGEKLSSVFSEKMITYDTEVEEIK